MSAEPGASKTGDPAGHEVAEYERDDAALRDGIAEDDHRIPIWFNVTFLGTILFALVYIPFYTLSGWTSKGMYDAELAAAEAKRAALVASLPKTNPFRGNAQALAEGKEVFATICVACHQADGTGLVGPSLVDPYWKYGDSDEALFETVSNGRPLGMPPWGTQLGNDKIWKVLIYLETLPRSAKPGLGAPDFVPPNGGSPSAG
jgi:cytochrome c oxidase cbb3-type subunit 3